MFFIMVKKGLKLSGLAKEILKARYLKKNKESRVIETPDRMFRRVAKAVAAADRNYSSKDIKRTEKTFLAMMENLDFLPNSPTLMNAGTRIGQLAACFVLPVEDSLESIYDTLKTTALIHQSGGGTGFSFSKLRPRGDLVRSTMSEASGPVSFMKEYDVATQVIKQGGRRRGAMMGALRIDHPDILEFIRAKDKEDAFTNFNLSVIVTDRFMDSAKKNKSYNLINPRTKKKAGTMNARKVFDAIVDSAWKTGDPGLIFIDEINRKNPTPKLGKIESTNPCGEQPLLPYESCNLGSINISNMIKNSKTDWDKLKTTVHDAVHFLDNVIDVSKYPVKKIEKVTKGNRKIGLGVMGFAEYLIRLRIQYNSEKALQAAEKLMKFIHAEAIKASRQLAKKRGVFPNYKKSIWRKKNTRIRNAALTTIAPTGTIALVAGTSHGIEPLFAVAYKRKILNHKKFLIVNSLFEKTAKEKGFYSRKLIKKITNLGSIQKIKEIPKEIRRLFVTTFDIQPEQHVKMQAAFQKYVDNAVSKTVNLPNSATRKDIKKIYMLAHRLKCKGITIYRTGSKREQVVGMM
ncbi:adenosylcobalamin-dependent ribonucleoside-diphosphate reductase [Candidatus Woesearchaeota archaeon]|nr:adenosylcobalamin-dependent ribonucleoside-diphosphate reductase [Candidatus Woesearchaeota archaeon]